MAVKQPTKQDVLGTSIALPLICLILVILRFYSRYTQKMRPRIDDWLCLISLVFMLGMAGAMIAGIAKDVLSHPTPDVFKDPVNYYTVEIQKIEWSLELMQLPQLGCAKLSFLFLFRSIFVTSNKSVFGIATWVMIAITFAWMTVYFFTFLFACGGHFDRWWTTVYQICLGIPFEYSYALSDPLLDTLIIAMPIPMVWNLHMTSYRKIAVTGIFALGALAVISSWVRLSIFFYMRSQSYKMLSLKEASGVDMDLNLTLIMFWTTVESALALIAACLPPLYGFFDRQCVSFFVRTARSIRGLTSKDRSHSATTHSQAKSNTLKRAESYDSNEPIVPSFVEPNRTETYVMKNIRENGDGVGNAYGSGIQVEKAISMQSEMV